MVKPLVIDIIYCASHNTYVSVPITIPTDVRDMLNGEGDIYIVNPYFNPSSIQDKFEDKQLLSAITNCKNLFSARESKSETGNQFNFVVYNMPIVFVKCNGKYTQYFQIAMKNADMSFFNPGLTKKEVEPGSKIYYWAKPQDPANDDFKETVETRHKLQLSTPEDKAKFEHIAEFEHKCLVTTCLIYAMMKAKLDINIFALIDSHRDELKAEYEADDGSTKSIVLSVTDDSGQINYYKTLINIITQQKCKFADKTYYQSEINKDASKRNKKHVYYDFNEYVTYVPDDKKPIDGNTQADPNSNIKIEYNIQAEIDDESKCKFLLAKKGTKTQSASNIFPDKHSGPVKKWIVRSILSKSEPGSDKDAERSRSYTLVMLYSSNPQYGTGEVIIKRSNGEMSRKINRDITVKDIYRKYGSTKSSHINIKAGVTMNMRGYMHSHNFSYQFTAVEIFYQAKKSSMQGADPGVFFDDIDIDSSQDDNDSNSDNDQPAAPRQKVANLDGEEDD